MLTFLLLCLVSVLFQFVGLLGNDNAAVLDPRAPLDSVVEIDQCIGGELPGRTLFNHTDAGSNQSSTLTAHGLNFVGFQGSAPIQISTDPAEHGKKFSRWRCIGDMEKSSDLVDRTCVFENVCYDKQVRDFVFFSPMPRESLTPILYDHRRGSQFLFRRRVDEGMDEDLDFVLLNNGDRPTRPQLWSPGIMYNSTESLSWSPRIHEGTIPDGHKTLAGVYSLSAPNRDPMNLGHVLWEDVFPIFVAMVQLGIYTPCLNLLRMRRCETGANYGSAKLCSKFEHGFLLPLAGSCGAKMVQFHDFIQEHQERMLCFETLMVGGSFTMFEDERYNVGKEPLVQSFRQVIMSWHGVNPIATPKSHQILLVDKHGQRSISNFKSVASHVAKVFSQVAHVCATTYSHMSIADQLHMLSRTSIAVSPCGGTSMILPFLPEGAYAILMNYAVILSGRKYWFNPVGSHGECSGCSWTMEAEFWRHVRHINKVYYQVFGPSDFEDGVVARHSSIRVNTSRLSKLIWGAIHEMEPHT